MSEQWREGNRVELLINGEAFFPRVFSEIAAARTEVLLETFIIFDDDVGRALQRALIGAARRGVRVEVIADGYGSADLGAEFVQALLAVGVKLRLFDPQPRLLGMRTNLFRRLHRKLLVIDGSIAFVGGINFSADHLATFGEMAKQDYAVAVQGPVVADIRQASLELLAANGIAAGREVPRRADNVGPCRACLVLRDNHHLRTNIEEHYLQAVRQARHGLVIANAYFFPGYRVLRALRQAARRGVKVRLILQGLPDMPLARLFSKLLYDTLLRDGIQIYEYCDRPLHGKVAVVDDQWATVGSSNLDPLSLSLNLESNLMIEDPSFCRYLDDHLASLARDGCRRVTRQAARRGYWWRAPLVYLSFHFLRHFPAMARQWPVHRQELSTPAIGSDRRFSWLRPLR